MHIDGSTNAKTECRYKFRVLYFRFILILPIKKKRISQKETRNFFNIRPLDFDFFCKFSEILNKLSGCTFKTKKVLQRF